MWAWAELKYADGFTLVLDSNEWGRLRSQDGSARHPQ